MPPRLSRAVDFSTVTMRAGVPGCCATSSGEFRLKGGRSPDYPHASCLRTDARSTAGLFAFQCREQMPLAGDAFERMSTAIDEAQARAGDKVLHHAGDQHLTGCGFTGDARTDVHGDAADFVAGELDLPGV